MKTLFIYLSLTFCFVISFAQNGQKWSTNGNSVNNNEFIGSTNNAPLLFKTNNITALKIKTDGAIIVNSFSNSGNGLVLFDNNGKLSQMPYSGNANQVLYGNGTWGNLPNIPTALWQQSGNNIFYNNGYIGIGTNNPLVSLDVIGDARISNNLYVGGGIIITEKVNASTEVKTASINADSIKMDSTKAVYGYALFKDKVKLENKLQVIGNTEINGNLKIGSLSLITPPPISLNPCAFEILGMDGNGGLVQMDLATEFSFDPNSPGCPEPPSIPFTWQTYGNHVNNDGRWIGTIENFDFRIKTNNTLRMTVKKDGKIGIGTATPTEFLDVNGNTIIRGNTNLLSKTTIGNQSIITGIHTDALLTVDGKVVSKSLYVTTVDWADYVFSPDYELMNINDLENYYKLHKHLPEIPSEKEIIETGINIAETNKLLLKKVEELTLYIVQQNKEIEKIKEEIKSIKSK